MNIEERAAQAAAWKATGQCNCCYRNTLHKLQDYVAVNSINQYHEIIYS